MRYFDCKTYFGIIRLWNWELVAEYVATMNEFGFRVSVMSGVTQ